MGVIAKKLGVHFTHKMTLKKWFTMIYNDLEKLALTNALNIIHVK